MSLRQVERAIPWMKDTRLYRDQHEKLGPPRPGATVSPMRGEQRQRFKHALLQRSFSLLLPRGKGGICGFIA